MADIERLIQIAQGLQIGNIRRHIFLCCDQTKPKCASKEVGLESWEYLKRRLAETGLLQGGHAVYPNGTPLNNLFLAMLDRMGVPTETLGDSTGKLQHLF